MNIQEFKQEHVDPKWWDTVDRIAAMMDKIYGDKLEFSVYRNIANWNVPLSSFPAGYHCTPGEPLPYIAIAAQKQHFAIYHMGIYADKDFYNWFVDEYPKHMKTKLNMGKSCIRFSRPDTMPYELIEEMLGKQSVAEWIGLYISHYQPKK